MGFWKGETCEYCQGNLVEKRVTLHRQHKKNHILVENVPAGVCKKCGTRYYSANVLKTVQEILRGRKKQERKVSVPVYSLS